MDLVRIESKNGIVNGSKVFTESGDEIHGITKIIVDFSIGDVVRAKIDLCMIDVDVKAHAEYQLCHPKTGDFKKIRRIEFDDGEVVEF